MNDLSPIAAGDAAQRSLVCDRDLASAILAAAGRLLPHLERGQRIDATMLRAAMEAAFGASDATGAWDWKNAYDACEAATVLFLRKYGKALFRKADSPASRLSALTKIAGLFPTHTRRSAESGAFQQFSTPIPLGLAALTAAAITPGDRVLEPSAGTGLLAILAEIAGASLALNELAETRADLLSSLFPDIAVTRFDGAQIDDHLDPALVPTTVLMNPPFSAMANVSGRMADAAYRHIKSALARVTDGGRLVAITGANFAPEAPAWRDAFIQLQKRGRVVFTAAIEGAVYAKHGTTIETRLTVIDKAPADDPRSFPESPGMAPNVATLLRWIGDRVPDRFPVAPDVAIPMSALAAPRTVRGYLARTVGAQPAKPSLADPDAVDLVYETTDWTPPEGAHLSDAIYEEYRLQSIRIPTLGAITRGQRQTGGQGLFRPEDNLESPYARDALRQLYLLLVRGKVEGCSLQAFEDATGLSLMDANGIKDDLPPITTFLNRLLALTIDLQGILFAAFEQLLNARIEGAIAGGVYDVGLETLQAESFIVTDRQTIYTHPATGAETRLLRITERRRNHPLCLDQALDHLSDRRPVLLVNERSGRAAVQIPAPSVMLDDGEIERRVRLVRPMEHHNVSLKTLVESHWLEADRDIFAAAWNGEVAQVPEFSDSTLHIVAGLLLPIWKRLPNESTRVYRLQTDEGERIIGRKVSPAWAANATTTGIDNLTPDAAFAALMEGRTVLDLAEGLLLRRVRVMGTHRIELSGFTDAMRDRLRAYGLFSEIISWKLRMFVPTDASGVDVLARVLDRYPVERIGEREAA